MERQWPRGRLDFLEVEGEEKRYLVKHWELPIRVVKNANNLYLQKTYNVLTKFLNITHFLHFYHIV